MRYTAYADDILIHDSASVNPVMHAINPKVVIQENAAGTFSFTLNKDNPGYNAIQRKITTIIVKSDNKIIWSGRVNSESENFWKQRTFDCEGALAFLNDINQPLHVYENYSMLTFLQAIIAIHNSKVNNNRKINLGYVTVTDMDDQFEYKTEYKSTWECFKESIFDRLGGHVRIRYIDGDPIPRLDYVKDYTVTSPQQIEFGMNLLNFTKNWDVTDLATVIIPLGKQLEEEISDGIYDRTNVASVNNGSIYVENTEAVATYGRIERIVEFNEVDSPSTLLSLANIYKNAQQFDEMQLEINALDLHYLNPEISSFKLFDQVRCISAPHGLNKNFPITEINIPLDSPEKVVYKMGASTQKNTLSGVSLAQNKSILQQITNMPSFTNLLDAAKRNASEILNARTVGYVTIVEENDESQALVISDTPDWLDSERLWKFNMNGLGYSSDGGDTYDLAITMNGNIVADFIQTGILSDGFGYNYWNLSTGEFTLAYNSKFKNQNNDEITIVDVVNMTTTNATNIASNTSDVRKSLNRQYGTFNLLHGSNAQMSLPSGTNDSQWSKGEWDGKLGPTAIKRIVDVSDLPNSSIVKALEIKTTNDYSTPTYFTQRNVVVSPEQVYVVSCYARMSGTESNNNKIYIQVGKIVSNPSTGLQVVSSDIPVDNKWRRYTFTFMTTANNVWSVTDSSNKRVHIANNKIDVSFGSSGYYQNVCQIAGMTLERGNTATDWSDSVWDTSDFSRYTSNQEVLKYDRTLDNFEIFHRITGGQANHGIYMTRTGQLLINAGYIKSGIMDAALVRAGILTDKTGKTKWDLDHSILSTSNVNITGGSIKFGNMTLNSSGLYVGSNNNYIGYSAGSGSFASGMIILGSHEGIQLVAPTMYVSKRRYYRGDGINGLRSTFNGEIEFRYVESIARDLSSWNHARVRIEVINGLIVSASLDTIYGSGSFGYDPEDEELGFE